MRLMWKVVCSISSSTAPCGQGALKGVSICYSPFEKDLAVRMKAAYSGEEDTCMSGSLGVQVRDLTRGLSWRIIDELSWVVTDRWAVLWVNARGPLNGCVGYNKMGFIPLWMGLWYCFVSYKRPRPTLVFSFRLLANVL